MKKSRIIYFLFGIIIINFAIFCFAGCKKDITICSFEFLNSETGEYVKPSLVNHYGEMFLTYNGEQKNIEFRTVRDDNGKEIKFIQNIDSVKIEEYWITGDVRQGRGEEKWLNLILRKN